jgi:hypothetical protein
MKLRKIIAGIVFSFLGLGGLYAQQNSITSGGEATGSGGTSSYSVGQVFYTTSTGTNGGVAQGIQQPYEISTITNINETSINLELSVYPNPTTNYLTLKVEDNTNLKYQLFDMQGKLIESKTVTEKNSTILMEKLPTAAYFLKVVKNHLVVKTFKIIKK